ncbi:MAG: hypothetical protein PHR06_01685 [Candidatus Cloacimonetes bacterium]|nr:hypothetical protein [Candidatus Cloacimonadota bacterium]
MERKLIICVIMTLLFIPYYAKDFDYKVNKPGELFIGTPFNITVDIFTAEGDSIFAPEMDTLDIFIVLDITQGKEIIENRELNRVNIKVAPFDAGEHTFPELEFTVKSGSKLTVHKTNSFQVFVKSVLPNEEQGQEPELRDISGPLDVSLKWYDYLMPIMVLLILILVIFLLLRYLRKPAVKNDESFQEPVDMRPAYIIALELLAELEQKEYLGRKEYLQLFFGLSYILRVFIEKQYGINAVEMTTSEIRRNLILENHLEKNEIMKNLQEADRVKFAKYIPTHEKSNEALVWLKRFLKSYEQRYQETRTDEKNEK